MKSPGERTSVVKVWKAVATEIPRSVLYRTRYITCERAGRVTEPVGESHGTIGMLERADLVDGAHMVPLDKLHFVRGATASLHKHRSATRCTAKGCNEPLVQAALVRD